MKLDDASGAERDWWVNALDPITRHERGSAQYREAKRDLLSRPVCYPDGRWSRIPPRTLDRKLADLARKGFAGLTRGKRKDAGTLRAFVTTRWDRAVSLDDATKARIGGELRDLIRGLQAKNVAQSQIALHGKALLKARTIAAGFDPGEAELDALCAVPTNRIRAERAYQRVGRKNSDSKAYEDARPRIMRSRDGLRPMDIIVGDVHPVDIYYRREDGSVATPKAIAWLDLATNRIWITLVFLDKGKGIRARDVVASFIEMVCAWGMPRALYLDNGSEYGWAEFITDALKLVDHRGQGLGEVAPWQERRSNLIKALPYNAAAKPIEGIFALLERLHFRVVPGWIGGDRLRKKTANHGREPEPFPGTVDELRALIGSCLVTYHASPQHRGATLKGKSPHGALQAAIDAGWEGAFFPDRDTLRMAFATTEIRDVRQGSIEVRKNGRGGSYTCPELQTYQGDRVSVLIPKYEDWTRLPVLDDDGRLLGFAEPNRAYGFLDRAGAVESQARARRHRAGVRQLERSAPKIDVAQLTKETAEKLHAEPKTPVAGHLAYNTIAREIGVKLLEAPEQRQSASEKNAEHRRLMADLARSFGFAGDSP